MEGKTDIREPKKRHRREWAIVALVVTLSFFLTRWFLGREPILDAFRNFDLAMMLGIGIVFVLSVFVVLVGFISIATVASNILILVRKPEEGDAWGHVLREMRLDRWRRFWSRDYKVWGTNALITFFGTGLYKNAIDNHYQYSDVLAIGLCWTLAAYVFGYIQSCLDENERTG